MIARDNDTRAALNTAARHLRRDRGEARRADASYGRLELAVG